MKTTTSITPPLKSPSYRTIRHVGSFPGMATLGPSSSPGMVASLESSPAAQAQPTAPISHTSPRTGGSRSRSRTSSPAASSTKSVGRLQAQQTRCTADFFSADLFLSLPTSPTTMPLLFLSHLVPSCLVSSRLLGVLVKRVLFLWPKQMSRRQKLHRDWRSDILRMFSDPIARNDPGGPM